MINYCVHNLVSGFGNYQYCVFLLADHMYPLSGSHLIPSTVSHTMEITDSPPDTPTRKQCKKGMNHVFLENVYIRYLKFHLCE